MCKYFSMVGACRSISMAITGNMNFGSGSVTFGRNGGLQSAKQEVTGMGELGKVTRPPVTGRTHGAVVAVRVIFY